MGGLLVPPWYSTETPSELSMSLVTFMLGFSTAIAAVTAVTIIHQARRTWVRSRRLLTHPYLIMVSVEWVSSVIISVISFLFIRDVIPPSFWLFFSILCLWVLQIQCIMHIILNRIALILCDARRARNLKWAVTLLIGAINISVFVIWMPARLQINSHWIYLNDKWDRIEKGIFLLIDLGLNLYFIHIVRSELINHGLTKYWHLYWFNVGMIFISISLDIILIGIMSMPKQSTFVYVQFHPLMYLIKLKIEMNMADLIIKIVKATSPAPGHELHRYAQTASIVPPPQQQRTSLSIGPTNTTDNSYNTKKSTIPFSYSRTNVLGPEATLSNNTSSNTSSSHNNSYNSYSSYNNNNNNSSNNNNNDTNNSSNKDEEGWALTRLPSNFDAGDVVDRRRASVAEGNTGMVPLTTLVRPALLRNMSELTQLEVGAGYLDRDVRGKRTSGTIEQSPV